MRLGVLGNGRAARTVAPLLKGAGHELVWRWSRMDGGPILKLPAVDAVLLAVSDGAIAEVTELLAERPSATEEVWLHLSGALPSEAVRWDPERPRAAGTLHPMVALPGDGAGSNLLVGATCGIAGDAPALEAARLLGESLQMTAMEIHDSQRALYHAAAVTVAGHATALLSQAVTMLERVGFEEPQARRALVSLMTTALANLSDGTADEEITGPVARGDATTVRLHLEALQREVPELLSTYLSLAQTALALSRNSLTPAKAQAVERVLAGFTP